ncbi:MAG: hypothetical protein RIS85_2424 [Pseudomonadota bacterium]
MKALFFSPAAQADIGNIWDYSAEDWGADQADLYIDAIRDTCEALASGTRHARASDARPGYLKCALNAHMIYFRTCETRVEVIRILHGKQDVQRHL